MVMKIISIIGHPLLMASYVSTILALNTPELLGINPQVVHYFLLAVFLTTCLIPAISIFSLRFFTQISNLELTVREERPIPFLMILIWYSVTSYLFIFKLQLGKPFSLIIISVTVLIGILLLVTRWFKISIHATAAWASAGILAAIAILYGVLDREILFLLILLAGLTSSSRLSMNYHTSREIWIGTVLGFIYGFTSVYLFA